MFGLFARFNISINPKKTFIGYPSITLLRQKVNSLSLATLEEKLYAILKLAFPKTLSMLETYLGITGWLRDYIPRYAEILKPLMKRKTVLLVRSPPSGQ